MESVRSQAPSFDVRLFGTPRGVKRVGLGATLALGLVMEVSQGLTYLRYHETLANPWQWALYLVAGLAPVAFVGRAWLYLRRAHLSEDAELHVWRLLFSFAVVAYMMLLFVDQMLFLALHGPFAK